MQEVNCTYKIAVKLMNKEEEIKELNERVRILERDLKIANDRLHIKNYTSGQDEIIHLKLEKKYEKLNEEFGKLEIENLSLRDTLKVIL